MKKIGILFGVFLGLILMSSCGEKIISEEVLFERGSKEWFSFGDAKWRYENDELTARIDSGSGYAMTFKTYTNFILELEFKPDSSINSGVFIRCKEKTISDVDCYEINIWDLNPNQDYSTGAVVKRAKAIEKVPTLKTWNTYKIKNNNDRLQVWLNGIKTIDIVDTELSKGTIGLQAAKTGEILFRNVRLYNLEDPPTD